MLRIAKQLSGNTILIINVINNNIKRYPSFNSAARNLNVNKQMLHYYMKKNILLQDKFLIVKFFKLEFMPSAAKQRCLALSTDNLESTNG